jgi:hypothetical protein
MNIGPEWFRYELQVEHILHNHDKKRHYIPIFRFADATVRAGPGGVRLDPPAVGRAT